MSGGDAAVTGAWRAAVAAKTVDWTETA